MSLKVWIDGRLYDKADAKISVYDHGLLYGGEAIPDGVVDGLMHGLLYLVCGMLLGLRVC